MRTEPQQVTGDRVRATHRDHQHTFGAQVAIEPAGQGLDRELITDAFDQHHRAGIARQRGVELHEPAA